MDNVTLKAANAFAHRKPGNPYQYLTHEWIAWNEGWLNKKKQLEEKCFEEGKRACEHGIGCDGNPYDHRDNIIDASNRILDCLPGSAWCEGWVITKERLIKELRTLNRDKIEKCYQELKVHEDKWTSHAKVAFEGGLIRNGLGYLKSKAVIEDIQNVLSDSRERLFLLQHEYIIYLGYDRWDLLDNLKHALVKYKYCCYKNTL